MSREAWIAIAVVVAIIALITLIAAIRLVGKLFSARKMLDELGGGGKWVFWAAMIYTIFPFDILPDPIYLDDMAVLGGALVYLHRLIKKKGGLKAVLPQSGRQTTPSRDRGSISSRSS